MFQQKWEAKKETRAYHGDHLGERQFKAIWNKRLIGVASDNSRDLRKIPLPSQTYASLEKRLDTAVFRAMFASSVRQAKQIIAHGKVKVNGVQVKQPGMILKAGDLFEVDSAAVIMCVSPPRAPSQSKDLDENSQDDSSETRTKAKEAWTETGRSNFIPKAYMSAFAFVPNFLEVSYETCSAVYLRDPVAKPGITEVPSPLPSSVHALAANFYQRGR